MRTLVETLKVEQTLLSVLFRQDCQRGRVRNRSFFVNCPSSGIVCHAICG